MSKFDRILELEEALKTDEYGEWIIDREHKGTPDDPIHAPFPNYTEIVRKLIYAVYDFHEENPEYDLVRYREILEEKGYGQLKPDKVDVENADDKCIMALLMYIVRGERFCDGLILYALKSGAVLKWMERLRQIDEKEA